MRRTVLDVENKVTYKSYIDRNGKEHKWTDGTPYEVENYLVSVGVVRDPVHAPSDTDYWCFEHNDYPEHTPDEEHYHLSELLRNTDLLICHNAKHDLGWLLECGFEYTGNVYCTQIAEYVMMKGIKKSLKLNALAEEHNLPRKRSDLVDEYWDQGIGFEAMPWEVVEEYGRADCVTTAHLFRNQMKRLITQEPGLVPTITMMCAFLKDILEMERNGVKIDMEALAKLKQEYMQELHQLDQDLETMVRSVLGDTPIDMNSVDFRSMMLYSRVVKDKKIWKETFNLGKDKYGKDKYRPKIAKKKFETLVKRLTTVAQKTEAIPCEDCNGRGHLYKVTKAGVPYKNQPQCKACAGVGIQYRLTGEVAGFKIKPRGVQDLAAAGFTTNKEDLAYIATSDVPEDAKLFIEKSSRRAAITTYLSTYVEGIERYVGADSILHTTLNQTVAATARLSSTAPNLHNQPRERTFPIRRVFVSRFADGKIGDGDYGQLEFRAAGFLSGDELVRQELEEGVDAHAFTRDTINSFDPDLEQIDRQTAKAHTFKPLYGGQSGSPRERAYYKAFIEKYQGIKSWHESLKATAIRNGEVVNPTGRAYAFPNAKRLSSGYVLGTTQIVNYPVQGFATGDLVPLGIISLGRRFKVAGLKSLIVLTVHDSVLVDIYPGEQEQVVEMVREGLLDLDTMCQEFYDFEFTYPIEVDVKVGPNWLETKEV
jgi:DNA polymerase I-like protein with 3'-5' exonuclease and polymerase domains|tara:strand:+ start:2174 stop:4294 length:2121 start_codon:yes stop_codon:yes gene_type:complete